MWFPAFSLVLKLIKNIGLLVDPQRSLHTIGSLKYQSDLDFFSSGKQKKNILSSSVSHSHVSRLHVGVLCFFLKSVLVVC